MSTEEGLSQLTEARTSINNIMYDLVSVPAFPTDYNREQFLFSELESLLAVLNMKQQKRYKESFILLRTIFEKFLFFWLMFNGNKYRHPMTYNILRQTSKTDKEARDSALARWKKEWSEGAEHFRQVVSMDPGKKDNVIKVLYIFEGLQLTRNGIATGEILPIYNSILEEYRPGVAHLASLEYMTGGLPSSDNAQVIELQKTIYHNFFYIESIFRNLRLNELIDSNQLERIRVHYNFLSNYVHVSMANLDIWKDTTDEKSFEDKSYDRLIFLYVAKLFHLYIKVYVNGYQNPVTNTKYSQIIDNLESLSKDMWFFDNEPTQYDIQNSEKIKLMRKSIGEPIPDDTIYYNNPFERMEGLLNQNET